MNKYNIGLIALLGGAKAVSINPTIHSQVLSQVKEDDEFSGWFDYFILDALEDALEDAADWVETAVDDAGELLEAAPENASDWIETAVDDAGDWLEDTWDDASDWLENALEDNIEFWEGVWEYVEDHIIDPIRGWFEEDEDNGIFDFFEKTWELFVIAFAIFEDWSNDIGLTEAFEEAGEWMYGTWYDARAWTKSP